MSSPEPASPLEPQVTVDSTNAERISAACMQATAAAMAHMTTTMQQQGHAPSGM